MFLVETAQSEASGGSPWTTIILFGGLFALMYFLFIRPQSRRRKEAQQMQRQLDVGDQVLTIGGMYGTVHAVDGDEVELEVADGVIMRYSRQAVARVVESVNSEADDAADEAAAGDEPDRPASPVQESR